MLMRYGAFYELYSPNNIPGINNYRPPAKTLLIEINI